MLPASAAHCYEPPPRTLKPQNSPHATRRMWPSGHQNSPTQNPEMCRCRWVEQKKSRIVHPKWRQRRSLSIAVAVAVAPSIAACTNRRACENNNPPAHRSRGAVGGEKRSTCAGRQSRMDEFRGPPAPTHPVRSPILDPGRAPGRLSTRAGASRHPVFRTHFRASSTTCGQALRLRYP